MLFKKIVNFIIKNYFDVMVMVFLVDECFEEVIDFCESVQGVQVIVLIFDELLQYYVCVVEFVYECVCCIVEEGGYVVILFDFIICFVCVNNFVMFFMGCMFLGGLDFNVLYWFKCFLGVVCNICEGGSLIILVIVLVEIGSCMDDVIFEEFKGIGNVEFVLLCCLEER